MTLVEPANTPTMEYRQCEWSIVYQMPPQGDRFPIGVAYASSVWSAFRGSCFERMICAASTHARSVCHVSVPRRIGRFFAEVTIVEIIVVGITFVRNAPLLGEPSAKIDQSATFAAEGHRLGLLRVKELIALRAAKTHGRVGRFCRSGELRDNDE